MRRYGEPLTEPFTVPNLWSEPPGETNNPLLADELNYYKVEKWTEDGMKVDRLLYAGNDLDKARELFAEAIKSRPRIRLTIRQRTRVLEQWPKQSGPPSLFSR